MATLRETLVNTINEFNKLMNENIPHEQKVEIRKKRRLYFALLEEIIDQELPASTPGFDKVISALKKAAETAQKARGNIQLVSEALTAIAAAANVVDEIVKTGMGML